MSDVQCHKNDPTVNKLHGQKFNTLKKITLYPHGINRAVLNPIHPLISGI